MTWDAAKEATRDSEMRARIGGVAAQMEKFDFFFGVELGRKILNMADNLSRSLQEKCISACEGQKLISLTLATFQSIRSDECFDLFWDYVEGRRSMVDVSSPSLPRQRNTSQKEYFCEVVKLVKLILVMPVTNAQSERSFSALRRLKTWLRTTTSQARLNWCMILHIHQERTDALPMLSVANEFVTRSDNRMRIFGQFK